MVLVRFNISSLILEMYNTRPTTRERPGTEKERGRETERELVVNSRYIFIFIKY